MKQGYLIFKETANISFYTDDYFVSKTNRAVYEYIKKWPDWSDKFLVICGENGSGKTHLAHIWQNFSHAKFLSDQHFNHHSNINNTLSQNSKLIIDNDKFLAEEEKFLYFYDFLLMKAV